MIFKNFHNGINIGGWLSQYEFLAQQPPNGDNLKSHFDSFITENDIRQIAAWGFDHVRLPVSGYLLYDREADLVNKHILSYIERCINWCSKYHLNLVLDLHDLWGNIYGAMDKPMPLLTDHNLQNIYLHVWDDLSRYFKSSSKCILLFELLNEVSDSTGYLWNKLYKKAVHVIRRNNPVQPVLIGSNCQNNAAYLDRLDLVEDDNAFYNFHYYDPQVFTHQKAHFSDEMRDFNKTVTYPGDISDFSEYLIRHPEYEMKYHLVATETQNDKALMDKLLQPAIDFVNYSGRELYCGEFGVIDSAPPDEAVKWMKDFLCIADLHHIGHCIWNYKSLDFGLLRIDGTIVSKTILDFLTDYNSGNM